MTDQPDGEGLRDLLFAVRQFVLAAPNRTYGEKVLRHIDTMLTILPTHDGTEGAVLRHHANESLEEQEYLLCASAPPKPAPDAMREALESLADWCSAERAKIGAVDGYDYRSGEEFGLRRVEIEITKRNLSRQAPHSSSETES